MTTRNQKIEQAKQLTQYVKETKNILYKEYGIDKVAEDESIDFSTMSDAELDAYIECKDGEMSLMNGSTAEDIYDFLTKGNDNEQL